VVLYKVKLFGLVYGVISIVIGLGLLGVCRDHVIIYRIDLVNFGYKLNFFIIRD
jgi:hypothetical protein